MSRDSTTTPRVCPLTGNTSFEYVRKGDAVYLRDPESGIIFLAEQPPLADMASFVDAEYEAGVYRDYVNARDLKLATMRRRLPLIREYAHGSRLLDVGSGSGFFIEAALEAGFDASGIELSPVAISLAESAVQARITRGDVNALVTDGLEFDVVTAFDIIEHVFDPGAFLDDIGRVLAPGGLLVVSTPDTGHWLRLPMRSRWPMLQPDQHMFLFSRRAMLTLLASHGYEPLVIKTERKVLTVDYLFGQLRQTNPTLARYLERAKRLLPGAARRREVAFNIGEMLVFARRSRVASD